MYAINTAVATLLAGSTDLAVVLSINSAYNRSTTAYEDVRFCRANKPLSSIPNLLDSMSPIAQSVDPLTRETTAGSTTFRIIDTGTGSAARVSLLTTHNIKGCAVVAVLGPPSIAYTDWPTIFAGVVEDVVPLDGFIEVRCGPKTKAAYDKQLAGLWAGKHPAELAYDILTWAGVPSTEIQTTTFAYNYDATKSHYVVRRKDVSWDGGESANGTIDANGAIDDARVYGWKLKGICSENSNLGSIYPVVTVMSSGSLLKVELYSHYDSTKKLIGSGQIQGYPLASGAYTIPIAPPLVWSPGPSPTSQPMENGITGSVVVKFAGASYTISLASTSYLTGDQARYGDPVKAIDALHDLARFGGATICEREDGLVEWIPFLPATAVVDTWTDGVDMSAPLQFEQSIGNLINSVKARTEYLLPGRTEYIEKLIEIHTYREDSQDQHSPDGGTTPGVFEETVNNSWANSMAVITADLAIGGTSFTVGRVSDGTDYFGSLVRNFGMCGTGGVTAGPTQEAARKAAAASGRYVYFLLLGPSASEIVKVGTTAISTIGSEITITDPQTGGSVSKAQSYQIACSNVSRGQLGTSARAWKVGECHVYDITLSVEVSARMLDRFECGCPVITRETNLSKLGVQLCDFVGLVSDRIAGEGFDGVTASTKWEVLSKEVAPFDSPPRIIWKLARVAPAATTTSHYAIGDIRPGAGRDRGGWGNERIGNGSAGQWADQITHGIFDETSERDNDLSNGDFGHAKNPAVAPPDRWMPDESTTTTYGTHVESSTTRASGTRSLKFASGGGTGTHGARHKSTPCTGGELYSASAIVRSDSTDADDNHGISIMWLDVDGADISEDTLLDDQISGDTWQKIGPLYFVAPATAVAYNVYISRVANSAHNFYVDNVRVKLALYGAHVYLTTNLTHAHDGVETTVPFETEDFDIGGGYDTGTYTYTVVSPGIYSISTELGLDKLHDGARWISRLYVNAAVKAIDIRESFGGDYAMVVHLTIPSMYLNTGDTVHVTVEQDSGVQATIYEDTGFTYFSIQQVTR